jgi:aryl-alcohol dehydrogenase-like predicted oxidoreductase
MQYTNLGKSQLSVSRIAFGCMSLSNDEAHGIELLRAAIASGINFFDTADLYQKGLNEEIVGKALRPYRKDVVLATKVGNQWRADGSGWDWNPTKAYIMKSIEESLRRLGTDYVDLYQLHGGTIDDPIDETIEAFETLKQQGKIRHYGISSIRPNVIRAYATRSNIVSVMMQYSLLDRRPEETILNLLQESGIGVLTRGTLAGGLLIDKEAKSYLDRTPAEVENSKNAVQKISTNRTKTEVALQFALHHPAVTSAVVGIRTLKQLEEATHASNATPLSKDEYTMLSASIRPNTYQDHR